MQVVWCVPELQIGTQQFSFLLRMNENELKEMELKTI